MYKRSWLRWVSAYWELGGRCMQNTEMPWSEQPWWPCIYPKCVACIRKEFVSNAAKMHLMNTKWSGCSRQCWHLKGQQQQNQNKQTKKHTNNNGLRKQNKKKTPRCFYSSNPQCQQWLYLIFMDVVIEAQPTAVLKMSITFCYWSVEI